ncbi:MAG: class I SAM-dependent methyltransferase, partial [Dehalococcoidia bacterium]
MTEDRWGFNDWAKSYDEDVYDTTRPDQFTFQDYDRVLDTIVEYCDLPHNTCTRILDIGIGTGNLARRFLHSGIPITGIDPSTGMMETCRRKFPDIALMPGHFLDIPLPPQSIGLIVSSYAFHHLTASEKERSVGIMKNVLSPGGRIIIADLMFWNEAERQRIERSYFEAGRPEVPAEYAGEFPGYFEDLVAAFSSVGFTVDGEQLTQAVW